VISAPRRAVEGRGATIRLPLLALKLPGVGRESGEGTKKGSTSEAAVFKLPAYDPVGIAVMGFGIMFAVALALVF